MSTTPVFMPPRFQEGPVTTALQLGPLASLAGSWKGNGFNQIWRPDNPASQPVGGAIKRFLELNLTSETLDFSVIPGAIPNRGLNPQVDLNLYGLHYLQRVTDADPPPFSTAGEALHIEPGLFMSVPASVIPSQPASIVRLASIPHGVAVLMQGVNPGTTPVSGPPVIPPRLPDPGSSDVHAGQPRIGTRYPASQYQPGLSPRRRARSARGQHIPRRGGFAEQWSVPGVLPGFDRRSQLLVAVGDCGPGYPRHDHDPTLHNRRRQRA